MNNLRPCKVDGINALFHRWEQFSVIVEESYLIGGHTAGQVSNVYGICEYENGEVKRVQPYFIKFLDSRFNEYNFCEVEDGKENEE